MNWVALVHVGERGHDQRITASSEARVMRTAARIVEAVGRQRRVIINSGPMTVASDTARVLQLPLDAMTPRVLQWLSQRDRHEDDLPRQVMRVRDSIVANAILCELCVFVLDGELISAVLNAMSRFYSDEPMAGDRLLSGEAFLLKVPQCTLHIIRDHGGTTSLGRPA